MSSPTKRGKDCSFLLNLFKIIGFLALIGLFFFSTGSFLEIYVSFDFDN